MPIHDWTRVTAGTWHAFHLGWIAEIQQSLNGGLLPPEYYALAEQIAGPLGPDVLALHVPNNSDPATNGKHFDSSGGGIAVATAAPPMRITAEAEMNDYVLKRRTIVIRHSSGDDIVALLEIVFPGNKGATNARRTDWRSGSSPDRQWPRRYASEAARHTSRRTPGGVPPDPCSRG